MNITIETQEFDNGFTAEADIFERKPLFNQMIRLILNSPDSNLVFALDDIWGSGKTSFVKMMQSELKISHSNEIDVIYFDSFENDYQADPFISISSELYALLKSKGICAEDIASKILKTATKIGARALTGSAKFALGTFTAGVVNGTVIDKTTEAISNAISGEIESFVEDKIKSMEQEKKSIIDFKDSLEKIYTNTGRKTLIIIDELDRARPDYSLELLEKIKHLFSVKGLVFLLVMNREQFEKGIAYRYGDINTNLYLNKFIHYWFTLPKISMYDPPHEKKHGYTTIDEYIQRLIKKNNSLGISHNGVFARLISLLIEANSCSLREAERCISTLLVVDNHVRIANNEETYYMISLALICFLKVVHPSILNQIMKKESNPDKLMESLKLNQSKIIDNKSERLLRDILTYYYLSGEELDKLRKENNDLIIRIEGKYHFEANYIQDIAKSLNNLIVQ
ncbi:P-loop NTPase fold protein [Klebsiella pneumoniae]|uniref:KAP family P-loop NTPase fold protein n=1 Tax=Klebsiella pneumoniae TaxID=573 RepID=UPI002840EC54|nr:P-loop NTPase fold protein [Klebsiella pneumoniae]MDR4704205.1 P-loop NTPase fold protein [Klebsiella pneumoniae]